MPKQIKALINPLLLKWARETSGFTIEDTAQLLKRSSDEIAKWETGELQPSVPQARNAANLFKRPLAVFYLPEPPRDFQLLQDFRCLPNDTSSRYSHELSLLVRNAQDHQSWAQEYFEESGIDKLDFVGSINIHDSTVSAVRAIRHVLGVTQEDIFSCSNRDEAFSYWLHQTEESGVFVFRSRSVDCEEARGFALSDSFAPFIFVNSNDSKSAQIFTLLHELVHIFLAQSGVSNLVDFPSSQRHSKQAEIEIFCNRVAAEILLDSAIFNTMWRDSTDSVLEDRINQIANKFNVSREVVSRRLLDQGLIQRNTYLKLKDQYISDWLYEQKKQRERNRASEGGPSPHLMKVVTNGYAFTSLVISAYQSGAVSGSETSAILGIKLNHLAKVGHYAGVVFGGGSHS